MRTMQIIQASLLVFSIFVALLGGPRLRRAAIGLNVMILLLCLVFVMIRWVEA